MTADIRLPPCWLLVVSLFVNGEAHTVAAENLPSGVCIEKGRVEITLSTAEQQYALPAKIRISLQLRNTTDQRDMVRRVFPIAAPPPLHGFRAKTPQCRVMVDDKSVNFETKLIVDPSEATQVQPNREQQIAWSKRLEEWFAQDENLSALISRYRQLASVQTEMSELTGTFRERVKRHLIHEDLEYAALEVANGGPYFGYLVKLMPEIEPAYRIDGKFQRWEYVSLLSDNAPEVYRPYEKEWREQADKWFASKPDLILILPKLRELWGSFRESQELLDGPILKHLHDVNGLSLPVAVQFQSFIGSGHDTPSTDMMCTMFPDVDAQLKQESIEVSGRLCERGFDESVVSPFTGKLMPYSSVPMPFARTLEHDETVLAELGRPEKKTALVQRNRQAIITPMLISFDAPLDGMSSTTVVIEYDTALLPLLHPMSSSLSFGAAAEVMAVFPSPQNVPFSVTCPADFQPIISPGPRTVTILKNGGRRFDGLLNGEQTVLHVAAVNIGKDPSSWTSRFSDRDSRLQHDLKALIERIDNLTVRPLLMTSQYATLLQKGELWNAHQLSLQIRIDHSDFGGLLDSLPGHLHMAKEATQLHEWVMQKATSPSLTTDGDLNRFHQQSGNDGQKLTAAALAALADRVAQLKEDSLTLQEKMGRRFILCQAGIDTQENLNVLLELAGANPLEAHFSLKLVQFLTIEKSSALPYVIGQIDLDLRDKARAGKVKTDSFEWIRQNYAYHAMASFHSPQVATQLIEFIHSTDDSLLVQGAITALGHMTLPDHFEELTGIVDRIAASSGSGYIMYLDLLIRSDRDRAVPFLETLPKRHPEFAGYVLHALGRSGSPMALPQAIEVYRSSSDDDQLRAAVAVIQDMAEPKDIAALEYRKGLPDWMNESLVSVIRTRGGDESVFPFVEAYYKEFVRGKKKSNHLTCVAAFEETGDRRAIPYLREIFDSAERKHDAAEALGRLLLDRQIKRERIVDDSMDKHIRAISEPNQPEDKRAAAWEELLKTPEKSFERVMVNSSVRNVLEHSNSEWDEDDTDRCSFISGFGDVAAARLLSESDGCSLHKRYRIAHLLTMLLPGSRELIQDTADDKVADEDRRRTAQLALCLITMPTDGPILKETADCHK